MLSEAIEWIDVGIADALTLLDDPFGLVFVGFFVFAVWWRVRIIKRRRGEDSDPE